MRFFTFFCFISFVGLAKSQDCLENLYTANKLLDAGKTHECMALVAPCSSSKNDISARWQAYRLMSIAYILQGQNDSAKIAAENMLDLNPTYKPNLLRDPKAFINLVQSIVVIPKYTLGLAASIGRNSTFTEIPKGYVVADYKKTYTTNRTSYQLGTNLGIYFNPKLALDIGLYVTGKNYEINYSFSNWKVNVKERLNYLEIPITAKYIFKTINRTRFFAQAGVYAGYLLFSFNDFESNYNNSEQIFRLKNLNSLERRNRINYGYTAGLGLVYKLRNGHISLQADFYGSLAKINNPTKRYVYTEQIYTYFYVDDDIILHNLAINIGYSINMNYKVYRSKK
jgi:opacity protein-like surface antigen